MKNLKQLYDALETRRDFQIIKKVLMVELACLPKEALRT